MSQVKKMSAALVLATSIPVSVAIYNITSKDFPHLLDFPVADIQRVLMAEGPTPELSEFISTEGKLIAAYAAPKSRLRIDPRIRGVKDNNTYLIDVTGIKDGDTFAVTYQSGFCGWFPCPNSKGDIRVWGLDSGETKSGKGQSNADCPAEREAGKRAKEFAEAELLEAEIVYAYNLRSDPYNNRWVASIAYQSTVEAPLKYFHLEALQLLMPSGNNVFAHYNPSANKTLKRGGKSGFAKRKIWCDK